MPVHKSGDEFWIDSDLPAEPKLQKAVTQLIGELPILSVLEVNTQRPGIMAVTILYPLAGETHKALLRVATDESIAAAVARHDAEVPR
jgi:hypothetical protein